MGLFKNRQETQAVSGRQALEMKYAGARRDILIVLGFTIINIILLLVNANTYFLFSAYIPFMIADTAMFLCGKYPAEFYEGYAIEFQGQGVFVVLLVIAAVILVMYLLSWFFSDKGRVGWMVFAAVLFGLDTLGMVLLGGLSLDYAFDILFHAWFLYSLISGVCAYYKLKKLPPEEETPVLAEEAEPVTTTEE